MERIYVLLENIKDKSGAYIGDKNLHKLSTFLSGYECALYDITGERVFFDSTFQLYIEKVFNRKSYEGKHWDGILIERYGLEAAFDQFYFYLDDFKRKSSNTNGESLYKLSPEKERCEKQDVDLQYHIHKNLKD